MKSICKGRACSASSLLLFNTQQQQAFGPAGVAKMEVVVALECTCWHTLQQVLVTVAIVNSYNRREQGATDVAATNVIGLSNQGKLAIKCHEGGTAYLFLIPIEVCLHAALCLKSVSKLIGRISTLVQVPRQIEGHKGLRVTVHSGHQRRLWYRLGLGGLI